MKINDAGRRVASEAERKLRDLVGGWAREPGISDRLLGRSEPRAFPRGPSARELAAAIERLQRGGKPDIGGLASVGRLLGVEYLLLLTVSSGRLAARLFSVSKRAYAPQGYDAPDLRVEPLRRYVRAQLKPPESTASRIWKIVKRRWWIWVIAGALGAVTLGVALSTGNSTKGPLRIRVTR